MKFILRLLTFLMVGSGTALPQDTGNKAFKAVTEDEKIAFEKKHAFTLLQIIRNLDAIRNIVGKPKLVGPTEDALRKNIDQNGIRRLVVSFITIKKGAGSIWIIDDKTIRNWIALSDPSIEVNRSTPEKLAGLSFLLPGHVTGRPEIALLSYELYMRVGEDIAVIELLCDRPQK